MTLESVALGLCALALIFAVCECAQRFTNAFSDIADEFGQLHWYSYPVEVQQLLVPIIMYLQKPVGLVFFGSIACSREQFRKVNKSTLSSMIRLRNKNVSILVTKAMHIL